MTDLTDGMRSTGVKVRIESDRLERAADRLDELARVARISGDHMWVATTAHHIADPVQALADGLVLDAESLLYTGVGCYVCEEPFTPRLLTRRCKGEPK